MDAGPAGARLQRIERVGPGQDAAAPRPGDVLLVRGRGPLAALIYALQRLRFRRPEDAPYRYWSHAALVTSAAGRLVEAGPRGLVVQPLAKYRGHEYHHLRIETSTLRRRVAVGLAEARVGQRYAVPTFLALGVGALAGDRLRPAERGQQTCVAVVARAVALMTGTPLPRPAPAMMPADLARHLGARP